MCVFFPSTVRSQPLPRGPQHPPGAEHPQVPMAVVSSLANAFQLEVGPLVRPTSGPMRAAVEKKPAREPKPLRT
jgi:hypothetical protein